MGFKLAWTTIHSDKKEKRREGRRRRKVGSHVPIIQPLERRKQEDEKVR